MSQGGVDATAPTFPSTHLSLDEVLALPPVTWQIAKLLPKPGILVLGGPPKQGKSRLVRDILYRAARGVVACGRFAQPKTRSLLYNAEGGARAIREGAAAFARATQEERQRVRVYGPIIPCLTAPGGAVLGSVFEQFAREWRGYDLVVLDPLVNFHTADENNNQQMGAIMQAARLAAEAADVSLIIVHHSAKLGDEMVMMAKAQGGGKLRGASSIHGAADSVIMCWPHRGKSSMSLTFDLRYAPEEDELTMVTDLTTGRMFRQLPGNGPVDPLDYAQVFGWDAEGYQRAFRVPDAAMALFHSARRECS